MVFFWSSSSCVVGITYFSCAPDKGLFVREGNLTTDHQTEMNKAENEEDKMNKAEMNQLVTNQAEMNNKTEMNTTENEEDKSERVLEDVIPSVPESKEIERRMKLPSSKKSTEESNNIVTKNVVTKNVVSSVNINNVNMNTMNLSTSGLIGKELLEVHRSHVDEVLKCLKMEMIVLSTFEQNMNINSMDNNSDSENTDNGCSAHKVAVRIF